MAHHGGARDLAEGTDVWQAGGPVAGLENDFVLGLVLEPRDEVLLGARERLVDVGLAEGSARPKDGLSAESAPRPAFFGSAGGVVLMAYSGASLSVMDSSFEENSAKEGMQINWAGCVCAFGGLIALGSSEMVGNTAAGGLLIAGGGAIVGLFASIEINESSLVANMACGGEITPYA
jgi:hypothetical protein